MNTTTEFARRHRLAKLFRYSLYLASLLVLTACVDTPLIKRSKPAPVTQAGKPVSTSSASNKTPLYEAMTREDRRIADRTVRKALESALSGTTFRWHNPKSGHSGTVAPLATYKTTNGGYCRTYRESLSIGPRSQQYSDQACRDKKGIWRTVK